MHLSVKNTAHVLALSSWEEDVLGKQKSHLLGHSCNKDKDTKGVFQKVLHNLSEVVIFF